ncbi:MAG: c-type cytochrome [Labilithrix sp.]|nr:c-type cytochrome [Labilithrix sp.]
MLSSGGNIAYATDPDRDRVVIVDLVTKKARSVALRAGDEPGRIVTDGPNRVHVVLDRRGAIATIDTTSATVVARRAVCPAPLGIARDASTLYVACTGGEIVSMPTQPTGSPSVLARVDRDLRDIVIAGDSLLVSRLRSAEVLRVRRSDGAFVSRAVRPPPGPISERTEPFVAWRMVPSGSGGAVVVHQMARASEVNVEAPSGYAGFGPCGGSVETTITRFEPNGPTGDLDAVPHSLIGAAVAPVDIARSPTGRYWAVVAAGNGHTAALPQVQIVALGPAEACVFQGPRFHPKGKAAGQAVAVAFRPDDSVVVLSREPAELHLQTVGELSSPDGDWQTIPLGGETREDTGHAIFHSNTGGNIACVSCHPGGADDGRVWKLSSGARRTQTLQGTLQGTAPYHWSGDVPAIATFATDVFAKRMAGPNLDETQTKALDHWLVRIPAPVVSPPTDTAARSRGEALFASAAVGCSGCHSGAKLTNNESVDVGTGGTFQVPSLLGLALRAPYLHDGRAATLLDRFSAVGGGEEHGHTSDLTTAQLNDLVTYLESL